MVLDMGKLSRIKWVGPLYPKHPYRKDAGGLGLVCAAVNTTLALLAGRMALGPCSN